MNQSNEHRCARANDNVIFYSVLFRGWTLKIYPANYLEAKQAGIDLGTIMIEINYCPYCGVKP
jgi:hypothetical protein